VLKDLLDLLIPARCAACGARGDPCCPDCGRVWGGLHEVARVPTAGVVRVFALARYLGVGRKLLIAYKERGRRDLAQALGDALAKALPLLPGLGNRVCLVPAPSRAPVARARGGPHVLRLAEAAAAILAGRGFDVAVAPALRLAGGARDAVGLDRAGRVANLAGRVQFVPIGRPPPGLSVVVLDDVVTTGATAAACAQTLAAQGITVHAVLTLLAAG
jgi:predicted amidophosphoribosyltransferase